MILIKYLCWNQSDVFYRETQRERLFSLDRLKIVYRQMTTEFQSDYYRDLFKYELKLKQNFARLYWFTFRNMVGSHTMLTRLHKNNKNAQQKQRSNMTFKFY